MELLIDTCIPPSEVDLRTNRIDIESFKYLPSLSLRVLPNNTRQTNSPYELRSKFCIANREQSVKISNLHLQIFVLHLETTVLHPETTVLYSETTVLHPETTETTDRSSYEK